jgi:hypothetical protein
MRKIGQRGTSRHNLPPKRGPCLNMGFCEGEIMAVLFKIQDQLSHILVGDIPSGKCGGGSWIACQ